MYGSFGSMLGVKEKLALVVSTENLTENLYRGNERSMMMQNTLFRCGGVAVLLSSSEWNGRKIKVESSTSSLSSSSKQEGSSDSPSPTEEYSTSSSDRDPSDTHHSNSSNSSSAASSSLSSNPTAPITATIRKRTTCKKTTKSLFSSNGRYAKYKLLHSGRTLMHDNNSYNCVFQQQDSEGNKGVRLDKNIVSVAGRALTKQFTQIGPHVLPLSEQLKCVMSYVASFILKKHLCVWFPKSDLLKKLRENSWLLKGYTPDFKKAVDFFCIHAGGRAVIEGVQKNLNLDLNCLEFSV